MFDNILVRKTLVLDNKWWSKKLGRMKTLTNANFKVFAMFFFDNISVLSK